MPGSKLLPASDLILSPVPAPTGETVGGLRCKQILEWNACMANVKVRVLRFSWHGVAVAFLACFLLSDAMAAADNKNKDAARERQAVRRVQQQLNEAQQQKLALEQEKKALEEELKKIHDEAESQKRSAVRAAARASQYQKDIEAANKEKTGLHAQLEEAGKQNEDLSGQRKQLEQDLKQTMAALAKQTEWRKLCETKNEELYRIGLELAGWYNRKGALNAILEAEPFTRMKSVEIENLLEDYRDKVEGQRLEQAPR